LSHGLKLFVFVYSEALYPEYAEEKPVKAEPSAANPCVPPDEIPFSGFGPLLGGLGFCSLGTGSFCGLDS